MITWGASISQRQPTCRPRFESQAHQLCFNHLKYLCHICNVKKTKINKKRGFGTFKKIDHLKLYWSLPWCKYATSGGRDERLERKNSRNSASTKENDRPIVPTSSCSKLFRWNSDNFFPLNVRLWPIDEMLYWGDDQEEGVVELRLWGWG